MLLKYSFQNIPNEYSDGAVEQEYDDENSEFYNPVSDGADPFADCPNDYCPDD